MIGLTRRVFCAGSLAAIGIAGHTTEPTHDVTFAQDFDELWSTLGARYCFFAEKRTDWDRVRALYRPMALAAASDAAFTDVVQRTIAELYDAHTHLSDPPDGAPRWPPYDILVERDRGNVRIVAVQSGSAAADAELVAGDRIVNIAGQPIDTVAQDLAPRCLSRPDPAADAHAINVAVAGCRGQPRAFAIASSGRAPRQVALPVKSRTSSPDLDSRRLDGGIGYIAIRSFADPAIVGKFDAALAGLRDAPGLIIDVRGNGGGDTAVARPIMGRFISRPLPYAMMRRRERRGLSAPWTESVEPRGPFTFTPPVVVLADHWSGSMAEGFPMGMRDIGRAKIVGTRMMGLGAAVFAIRLDRAGLQAQYSGEPVYDTHDRPRWLLEPDISVAAGADILDAGLVALLRSPRF